ncbi:NADP-dependent oxidoreductase [Dactylosporangium roseum]|uniref:NADP-dependent oxidoreductase n=1 Tax=Dactylosporangium roseum TaxID=47989 RepID=A0ABY5ZGQ8_9ACTN|nr:NADP-dependent oxidoreductase [Dactylosporangium roseum]UWZ39449.1 NADP-dependent oxidoreductase [Dactylosporangium roseum]
MRAFVIPSPQCSSVELARVPVPRIGREELLVRIKAVGVGIHDSYFLPPGISYPFPIGIEAAGVVEEVGSAVAGHQPGDRIAFVSSMQVRGGTWAEYAAVRADSLIVPIPAGLDFEQAAAVPVAGNTTLRAFRTLPPIQAGGSIFVAGASGAIGTFAVQLARAKGWQVAASASQHNHEYLASLGATKIVDYHDRSWPDEIRRWRPGGTDAALAIQPNTTADSLRVVKDGGTVITISGDQVAPTPGVTVAMPSHSINVRDELVALMERIASGQMRLTIEKVYPFEDGLEALAKVRTRRARGKTVLTLR